MDTHQGKVPINIYQWGGGGRVVLQVLPKFWQVGTVKFGGYRTFGLGPFTLSFRCRG